MSTTSSGSLSGQSSHDSPDRPKRTIRTDVSRPADAMDLAPPRAVTQSGRLAPATRHVQERSDDSTRTVLGPTAEGASGDRAQMSQSYEASKLEASSSPQESQPEDHPTLFPLAGSSRRTTKHKPRFGSISRDPSKVEGDARIEDDLFGREAGDQPYPTDSLRSARSTTSSIERLSQALAAQTTSSPSGANPSSPQAGISPSSSAGLLPAFSHAAIGSWARKWTLGLGGGGDDEVHRSDPVETGPSEVKQEDMPSEGEAAIALLRRLGSQTGRRQSQADTVSQPAELATQHTGSSLWSWWGTLSGPGLPQQKPESVQLASSGTLEDLDDQAAIAELLKKMPQAVSTTSLRTVTSALRGVLSAASLESITTFLDNDGLRLVSDAFQQSLPDPRLFAINDISADQRGTGEVLLDLVKIFRCLLNTQAGFEAFMLQPSSLFQLVSCCHAGPLSLASAVAANEVLAALCDLLGNPTAVLDAFLDYRVVSGETFRFDSFVAALDIASSRQSEAAGDHDLSLVWTHRSSIMVVLNALISVMPDRSARDDMCGELDRRGLEDYLQILLQCDMPDSMAYQISVWQDARTPSIDEAVRPADQLENLFIKQDEVDLPDIPASRRASLRIALESPPPLQAGPDSLSDDQVAPQGFAPASLQEEILADTDSATSSGLTARPEEWDHRSGLPGQPSGPGAITSAYEEGEPPSAPPPPPLPPMASTFASQASDRGSPPPLPPPLPFIASPLGIPPPSPASNAVKRPKLKPLHWRPLKAVKPGTIWQDIALIDDSKPDMEDLVNIFSVAPVQAVQPVKKTEGSARILSNARATNIGVLLSSVRIPLSQIAQLVRDGELEDWTTERIRVLRRSLPSEEEARLLLSRKNKLDELDRAERFLFEVNGVPFVGERLDCIVYQREFDERLLDILPNLKILHKACRAIVDNHDLQVLLGTVLALGNALNAGTYRAGARGFAIEDLSKLTDVRSASKSTSLLHHLVRVLVDKQQVDVVKCLDDPSISSAANISPRELFADCAALMKGFESLCNFATKLQATEDGPLGDALQNFVNDSKDKISKLIRMVEAVKIEITHCLTYLDVTESSADALSDVMRVLSSFNAQITRAAEEIAPRSAEPAKGAVDKQTNAGSGPTALLQHLAQSPMVRNGQLNATIRTMRMSGAGSVRAGQLTARRNRMLWDGGSGRGSAFKQL